MINLNGKASLRKELKEMTNSLKTLQSKCDQLVEENKKLKEELIESAQEKIDLEEENKSLAAQLAFFTIRDLTIEEALELLYLHKLGYRYLAKNKNGEGVCFKNKPTRDEDDEEWHDSISGEYFILDAGSYDMISWYIEAVNLASFIKDDPSIKKLENLCNDSM